MRYLALFLFLFPLAALLRLPEGRRAMPGAAFARSYLLPNGWWITPAGRQVLLRDMPLNILPLAECRTALVATNGFNTHYLSLVDLVRGTVLSQKSVHQSWFGLALAPAEDRVWWSGGGANILHSYRLTGRQLTRIGGGEPKSQAGEKNAPQHAFRSGLALDPLRRRLYSLDINSGTISALGLDDGKPWRIAPCGRRPYDVVLAGDGARLFVSDWAGRCVLLVNPDDLRVLSRVGVGAHPNQMVLHPRDGRLFVACASSDCVSVVDPARAAVIETIRTPLFPRAPEGSTPDALALAPDGRTLYVANADNNCVAVLDISLPGHSQVKGFIPTGWYPTAVAVTPDNRTLLVGVGKGLRTEPNFPTAKEQEQGGVRAFHYPYSPTFLSGALSIVPIPDAAQLLGYTDRVYRNYPYSDRLLEQVPVTEKTAIPGRVGEPSPIKHVIYIIKENRTYDQVFGDLKEGNGDPNLVLFGEDITPNHHKLARDFVLLDNLYCNAEVSRDGHPWSTGAYATDYVARDWMLTYSGRQGVNEDDEGSLSRPPSGYLWDACARKGLSYRSYGEYGHRVSQPEGPFKIETQVPALVGHLCTDFEAPPVTGRPARDTDRVAVFIKEFRRFEKEGRLPALMIMSLGEDHTQGTTPGAPTPQASVASNDLALGRLMEAVTHSDSWPQSAIFVIEDDAQDGPDHVDCHRTVGLVLSPYTKRHAVDSTQYSTASMIRTLELILGLPPLSQYDAAAPPLFRSFTATADLTPYTCEPARTDLNAVNSKTAYGADRSARMDFSDYDRADEQELNEILWRAIKGLEKPLPAPVRCALASRRPGHLP
jgi:YVTN family beta-propeller protein